MSMMFENRNYAFAGAFVDELARCGLRHVCICPGSRSAPLTISFTRHPAIKSWVHLDERSASFYALGIAHALGEPVALVCTSGTAAANFYPAVVEAHYSSVPLLVLTTDRPPEVLEWGATQTIDQTRIYGTHAKWSASMPVPEATTALMAYVRAMACRAFWTARSSPAGPVHFNFPFRDPLQPTVVPTDFLEGTAETDNEAWYGRAAGRPFVSDTLSESRPSSEDVKSLAERLASVERGVVVCGPQLDAGLAEAVVALAQQLGYPVLADALSQVRCGPHDRSMVIDGYDAFLRVTELAESLAPDVVLRFGALPVSRSLIQYLERHHGAHHILIDEGTGWRDPSHLTSAVLHLDPVLFCSSLGSALQGRPATGDWMGEWRRVAQASRTAMLRELDGLDGMFEGKVFSELAKLLPNGSVLFAGNSMPVRDLDTFFPSTANRTSFLANRGASGIDGVVSTALGASAVSSGKLLLVLGDISFYHDMNGLLAANAHGLDATIIVINNDGGGIFSFVPHAAYEDAFEPYFSMPHGLTFRATAELYGLEYRLTEDWQQFDGAVGESMERAGTTIIEVPGDRARNVASHRQVWEAVAASIHASIGG